MSRRIPLSRPLKRALANLPAREKDRLLNRLLPQHPDLVKQLEFKLLEQGDAREDRRAELRVAIEQQAGELFHRFTSPAYLVREFRQLSGLITEHVKTTQDKEGEVELNLALFNAVLPDLTEELSTPIPNWTTALDKYVINRTFKLLRQLSKLDGEARLRQQLGLLTLGEAIYDIPSLRQKASEAGLDVNWLLSGQWPADL